jgi:hypothetical protein
MKQIYTILLSLTLGSAMLLNVHAEEATKPATDQKSGMHYPTWPEHAIPGSEAGDFVPPPPGPYMSTALTGIENGFGDDESSDNPHAFEPSPYFKPDMPWPRHNHLAQPERWLPEGGYQYAPPESTSSTPLVKHLRPDYPMAPPGYGGWGPNMPPQYPGQYGPAPTGSYPNW